MEQLLSLTARSDQVWGHHRLRHMSLIGNCIQRRLAFGKTKTDGLDGPPS